MNTMDKETALYWQEIMEKALQGDEEAAEIYLSEGWRRFENLLPTISEDIYEALNPPKPAPQREAWQLPPRICEWP